MGEQEYVDEILVSRIIDPDGRLIRYEMSREAYLADVQLALTLSDRAPVVVRGEDGRVRAELSSAGGPSWRRGALEDVASEVEALGQRLRRMLEDAERREREAAGG